ncbi:helix-turn-helix domain-containing protein [Mesobacillus foraminis]|uniref:helix-turn-helix domain-containing protein n=1 Tax=Mesobacillus foraminis TaxID=279826 RepID=UPI0039A0EB35
MAKKKIEALEEVKKNYVRMALETGNYSSVARKAGIDRTTIKRWIQEYEDEVREQMEDPASSILSAEPTKEELKAKYEQAMKLLGEKELEVAMLRNLLKKTQFRP